MKPMPHPPLPLATTSAFTSLASVARGDTDSWAQQLRVANQAASALERQPLATVRAPVPAEALPAQVRTFTLALPTLQGAHSGARMPGFLVHADAPETADSLSPGKAAPAPGVDDAVMEEQPPAAARRVTRLLAQQPEVRIHVQETAQGLSLWLGMNGQEAASRAAALLPELRRHLETQSQRLVAVVCNGEHIYRSRGSIQEET